MKLIAIAAAALGLAACTPHQVATFKTLDPASQRAVVDHLAAQQRPTGCVDAMRSVWPSHLWSWGEQVMWRESRHQPDAYNPSGASGCWQMMMPLHSGRFPAGCSAFDAFCNNVAAFNLYAEAGASPWRFSA